MKYCDIGRLTEIQTKFWQMKYFDIYRLTEIQIKFQLDAPKD